MTGTIQLHKHMVKQKEEKTERGSLRKAQLVGQSSRETLNSSTREESERNPGNKRISDEWIRQIFDDRRMEERTNSDLNCETDKATGR